MKKNIFKRILFGVVLLVNFINIARSVTVPEQVDFIKTLAQKNDFLFAVEGQTVKIFKITDKQLKFIKNLHDPDLSTPTKRTIIIKNKLLFEADSKKIHIWNISDIYNIKYVNKIKKGADSLEISDELLFAADDKKLNVFNISNIDEIEFITEREYVFSIKSLAIKNNFLFMDTITVKPEPDEGSIVANKGLFFINLDNFRKNFNVKKLDKKLKSKKNIISTKSLAISKNSLFAVRNKTVTIFDITDLNNIKEREKKLIGHEEDIRYITTDDQNQILYTGSIDNTIRAWNIDFTSKNFGKNIILDRHDDWVCSLLFDGKNQRLYSSSISNELFTWKVSQIVELLN